MVPGAHRDALLLVCGALTGAPEALPGGSRPAWAVGGSVALALHGLPVSCHDLDILTRAQDAEQVIAQIPGTAIEPLAFRTRGALRGHTARVRLGDIEVEILGDVENQLPDGSWTAPPPLREEIEQLELDGLRCPVFSLAALRSAYQAMGRGEKVALIDAAWG